MLPQTIEICHRCPRRQQQCSGRCPCLVDGRDIIEHAESLGCPKGYFESPASVPARVPIAAMEFGDWPLWAKAAKALAIPADAGIGDTVHRLLGTPGIVAKAVFKAIGVPCGCADRRAKWNQLYRLKG